MPRILQNKKEWFEILNNFMKCTKPEILRRYSDKRKENYRAKFYLPRSEKDQQKIIRWAKMNGFRWEYSADFRSNLASVNVYSPKIKEM